MPDGMEDIIQDFVTEAEEALEKVDPLFVELEDKGYDREILNDIFRSVHTIKGAAGFLGFRSIVEVSHRTEALMKKLRDGDMQITSSLISLILRSVDMLKSLLGHIKKQDGKEEDTAPLLDELERAWGEAPEKTAEETEATAPPEEQPVPSRDAVPPDVKSRGRAEESLPEASSPASRETGRQEKPEPEAPQAARAAREKEESPAAPSPRKELVRTLRVDVDRIDKVMNLTGEIVLVRNRLLNIGNFLEAKYATDIHVEGLQETVAFLDLVTSDIQLAVMKMRMQPIKKVFGKFPRLVRDISQNLGKEVQLSISGEETEVDRSVIEHIGDPMVHIIRNAIDHGIEPVLERKEKGKTAKGVLDITAYQQGSQIIIEVSDDGKGIDMERVKQKAIARGLLSEDEAQRITDNEAANLVFTPGFSTVEAATELSGRGVGMDVVKTNISKLNGYVEVQSTKDVGTTIRISIPLTLAIIQALMVRAGETQYAIPLGPIEETLKIGREDIDNVTGTPVVTIRERVHSLVELREILGYAAPDGQPEHRYVLVIAIGDRRFCVAVDELLGQEEVVIKAVEGIDTESTGILGATITGEGRIVLIIDPSSMAKIVAGISTV